MGQKRSAAERLFSEGYVFDFFQAVRLLTLLQPGVLPVGRRVDAANREAVMFGALPALKFPASSIYEIKAPPPQETLPRHEQVPPLMTVTFMGLTGPSGVLPVCYTEMLLRQERDARGAERTALRAWFDLFNHRLISFFYRAWEKYRFPFLYERIMLLGRATPETAEESLTSSVVLKRQQVEAQKDENVDHFAQVLFSLIGLGTPALRDRLAVWVLEEQWGLGDQGGHSDPTVSGVWQARVGPEMVSPQTVSINLNRPDQSVSIPAGLGINPALSIVPGMARLAPTAPAAPPRPPAALPGGWAREPTRKVLARIDDLALLYYAGLFAQRPRSAVILQQLLQDYFALPVQVRQFRGQWLRLEPSSQTRMGEEDGNCSLGVNVVAGERVWDVSSKIRLRLGPMRLIQFLAFLPDKKPPIPGGRPSPSHKRYFFLLVHLARLYLGPELDFEIQLVLQAREVPPCRMVKGEPNGARLGWDTWLLSEPAKKDAEEAVFEGEELFELPSDHGI